MRLEQERCFAQQHEHMEGLMYQLLEQVGELRKEVAALKGGTSSSATTAKGPESGETKR